MKTLLFLTSVLLASTSTCDNRTTSASTSQECTISTLHAWAANPAGVGESAVGASREAKSAQPLLPAHLFM